MEELDIEKAQMLPGPFVEKLPFPESEYKVLGTGSYGEVRKVGDYAVKLYKTGIDESTIREVSILRYLNHPNVLNILGIQLTPKTELVMPLANRTLDNFEYNDLNRKLIFYQLFRGLAYCHSMYVWHRDIKPANVLLFEDGPITTVKLADFGLAVYYAEPSKYSGDRNLNVVTRWWRAPELLLGDPAYTELVDVWSLGIMFVESFYPPGTVLIPADNELGQLYETLILLGNPASAWPEAKQLVEAYYKRSPFPPLKDLSAFEDKNYKKLVDKVGREASSVLKATVSWPTKRHSALEVLNLPYFDEVRQEVEANVPAKEIVFKSCGETMIERIAVPAFNLDYSMYRKELIGKIFSLSDLNDQTLFYACLLLDLYGPQIKNYKITAAAALTIAVELLFDGTKFFPIDYAQYIHPNLQKEILDKQRDLILKAAEFNLIHPTAFDFLFETGVDIKGTVTNNAKAVILDYRYATTLNPYEQAYMALLADNKQNTCLDKYMDNKKIELIKGYLKREREQRQRRQHEEEALRARVLGEQQEAEALQREEARQREAARRAKAFQLEKERQQEVARKAEARQRKEAERRAKEEQQRDPCINLLTQEGIVNRPEDREVIYGILTDPTYDNRSQILSCYERLKNLTL